MNSSSSSKDKVRVPNSEQDFGVQDIPTHLPIQMAVAPEQHPYRNTRVISSTDLSDEDDEENQQENIARHSLSPERLGVVGYVRDVAGFVKDVIHEAQDKNKPMHTRTTATHGQQHQAIDQTDFSQAKTQGETHTKEIDITPKHREAPLSESPKSPLAKAVTGIFPGLDPNASPGCSHAELLRNQMHNPDVDYDDQFLERKIQ